MNEARVTWTLRRRAAPEPARPGLRVLTSWDGMLHAPVAVAVAVPDRGRLSEIPAATRYGRRHGDVDADPPLAA